MSPSSSRSELAPGEIADAASEFLSLIDSGPGSKPMPLVELERSLDRLAFLHHFVAVGEEPGEGPLPPARDYLALRAAVASRFPSLGSYRLPSPVIQIGRGEIEVADAIDDITEIANELHDVQWYAENNRMQDALWHFRNGYRNHWREHVRGLQFHLQSLQTRAGPGGGGGTRNQPTA